MSDTLARVKELVAARRVIVSDHAWEKLTERELLPTEIVAGVQEAAVVEDYPDAHYGPSVLVLQVTRFHLPLHVL